MNVLLINPNRYKFPPVPPLGLEYIAACLENKGHASTIVDLTFSEDIYRDIDKAVDSFAPAIVGITVRNIDSCLYHTNEFFLDEIKDILIYVKSRYRLKAIIGGSGLSINPKATREYLNADYAIIGPSENIVHEVLTEIKHSKGKRTIYQGKFKPDRPCSRKPDLVDYKKYFDAGGIAGFETHKGCSSSCVYCLEARTPVSFKRIEDVLEEIRGFVTKGYNHFHLCDSEFNENLEYSLKFCSALKKSGIQIQWAVYMKPGNISKNLMSLMKETGIYLITLSVDSWKRRPDYWSAVERFISTAKQFGIKIAVDFLTGFPYETEETVLRYLDIFQRIKPDSVGINTYIRLYKSPRLTDIILKDTKLRDNLLGNTEDRAFIKPIFYNHISIDMIEQLISGDPLFRVEGLEKGVNYSRVGAKE